MLSYSSLVASRAVVLSTGKVLATGHGGHRIGRHPRPRKPLLWTRHLPRIGPVASEVDLVAHRPRFPRTGELSIAGNGCAAVSTPNSGGPRPSSLLHLFRAIHHKINGS
jgi:hypothetical protein